MNSYASTALKAADLISQGLDPKNAWEKASFHYFKPGSAAQKKGCPKNAFLGLYGVNPNGKNATYARNAVNYLRKNPNYKSIGNLWSIARGENEICHNSQMHVVLALWNAGYIK